MKRRKNVGEKGAVYYSRGAQPGTSVAGMPTVMNTRELATYLGLNPSTVIKKAENGEFPAFKIGNRWRFRSDDMDSWMRGKLAGADSFPQRVDRAFKKIRLGLEEAGYSARDVETLIQEVREDK